MPQLLTGTKPWGHLPVSFTPWTRVPLRKSCKTTTSIWGHSYLQGSNRGVTSLPASRRGRAYNYVQLRKVATTKQNHFDLGTPLPPGIKPWGHLPASFTPWTRVQQRKIVKTTKKDLRIWVPTLNVRKRDTTTTDIAMFSWFRT